MKLKCVCGKESSELPMASSRDEILKAGFINIMEENCNQLWVCLECRDKLRELANEVIKISGSRKVHLRWLTRSKEIEGYK